MKFLGSLLFLPFIIVFFASCMGVDSSDPANSEGQALATAGSEEVPSTAPVPQKVLDDCIAELKKQIPDREMKVIRSERGETSFIVDVAVTGVPNPWRCYHDGTRCTGTEYQGEG